MARGPKKKPKGSEPKKTSKTPEGLKVTRRVLFTLSTDDRSERGQQLVGALEAVEAAEAEWAATSKAHKNAMGKLEDAALKLRMAVRDGVEERDVACTWTKDFRDGVLRCHRDDTGELLEERPLSDEDRQANLRDLLADVAETPEPGTREALRDALAQVGRDLALHVVADWTDEQAAEAFRWAAAMHAQADNPDAPPPVEPEHVRDAAAGTKED